MINKPLKNMLQYLDHNPAQTLSVSLFIHSWRPTCSFQHLDVCPDEEGHGEEREAEGGGGRQQMENQQHPGQKVQAPLTWHYCERGAQAGG